MAGVHPAAEAPIRPARAPFPFPGASAGFFMSGRSPMSAATPRSVPRLPVRRRVTAASPTPEKLATFLRHLEESGSVSLAAERTGIARNTVYERRKADPAFALGWRRAVRMAAEGLRDAAIAGAHAGDDRLLMFVLRLLRPEVFGRAGRRRIPGQVRDLGRSRRDTSVAGGPATCEFPDERFPDNPCSENRPPTVDAGRTG